MEETKEKQLATAMELAGVVQELLRENVVGLVGEREGARFSFRLASGQNFRILVVEE